MSGRLIEVAAWDDEDEVSPTSAALMAEIDAMPKAWRALVYEFGYVIVNEFSHSFSARDARAQLEAWRRHRQEEWLATNFITPRSRRGFEERF